MAFNSESKVIIIGGGLGGLALAQGLKHADPPVPFHVFERDSSANFRSQGYRIRIMPNGAKALQALLPDHLWRAFEDTCGQVQQGMNGLDALTGKQPEAKSTSAGGRSGPPPLPEGKSYNADRAVLRNLLLDGLQNNITFEKMLKSYRIIDGGVEVTFADGTKEVGTIMVGADGTRSHIRQQLMPNFTVLDTEGRAVFGKTFNTPQLQASAAIELFQGMSLVGENTDSTANLLCDIMQFLPDMAAESKTKYKVPGDYIYWVLCFNKGSFPDIGDNFLKLDHQQSAERALEMTKAWHPSIRSLIESQDVPSSSSLAFYACSPETFAREWNTLPDKPSSARVTLLGDAAHPMSPVGGVGANTAFQEAADLRDVLVRLWSSPSEDGTVGALRDYAKLLVQRGEEIVKRSAGGAGHMFQMKPFSELKAVSF
ncbi:cercosporin toxin biosynthesis [Fusarium beomiforme]|uniref:Cercosporin toxin biosynthesis n=1 Tax=Fusarium beomiforme TaxID=44412 RepID=A0A9P5AHA7_9HYPO|nr:cercosporin toxin biosynthesis [Fusarium beomiforme]